MRKILVLALLLVNTIAVAQEAKKLTYGANLRLRQEFWQDVFDFNSKSGMENNFYRVKTSLWGKYDFSKGLGVYMKLTNEFRYYLEYMNTGGYNCYDPSEIVFDNLYVDYKNAMGMPLDLRFGRQDFLGVFGEGFLVMDGTPGDGSRTFYFNALRGTYKLNDRNTLEVAFINGQKEDNALPIIDTKHAVINSSDESAVVIYDKMKMSDLVSLDAYLINKTEEKIGATPKLSLNTVGGRTVYVLDPVKVRAELAYQSGEYDGGRKRTGMGSYVFISKTYKDYELSPEPEIGAVYLTGDNLTTADSEAWDPLFSRWPWMSELYILSYAKDTGIAGYWTNLLMYRFNLKLNTSAKSSLALNASILQSKDTTAQTALLSGSGMNRGTLLGSTFKYKVAKNIDTYLMWEYFLPGNFYRSHDPASFVRANVDLKF